MPRSVTTIARVAPRARSSSPAWLLVPGPATILVTCTNSNVSDRAMLVSSWYGLLHGRQGIPF